MPQVGKGSWLLLSWGFCVLGGESAWHAILKMKNVGVAVCTLGITYAYMAQKAIQNECAACGIERKVETRVVWVSRRS